MNRVILTVGSLFFVACLMACTGSGPSSGTEAKRDVKRVNEAPKLSIANYNALRDGMSYKQACDVIGFTGEEVSSNTIGGTRTVMYSWTGDFGANMNATFQNDRLMSKAQFGLK